MLNFPIRVRDSKVRQNFGQKTIQNEPMYNLQMNSKENTNWRGGVFLPKIQDFSTANWKMGGFKMEIVEVGMGSLSCNVGSVRNALSDQSIFRWSFNLPCWYFFNYLGRETKAWVKNASQMHSGEFFQGNKYSLETIMNLCSILVIVRKKKRKPFTKRIKRPGMYFRTITFQAGV